MWLLLAASVISAPNGKQPKWPGTSKWADKLWYSPQQNTNTRLKGKDSWYTQECRWISNTCWNTGEYLVGFHLYEILEKTSLLYSDCKQICGCVRRGVDGEGGVLGWCCYSLSQLCMILGFRNLSKLKKCFTYKMCALYLNKTGFKKYIPLQLPRNCWDRTGPSDITQVTFGRFCSLPFSFLPVSNSALLSSRAQWRMATPSALQTCSRL